MGRRGEGRAPRPPTTSRRASRTRPPGPGCRAVPWSVWTGGTPPRTARPPPRRTPARRAFPCRAALPFVRRRRSWLHRDAHLDEHTGVERRVVGGHELHAHHVRPRG